ncbi:barstar family protein [Streptomyces sp. NPDC059063]|uniref:barstar family protein n=1 Tax=unclassified Streptomyces TaxID=2593676 RepID=UPI0036B2DD89
MTTDEAGGPLAPVLDAVRGTGWTTLALDLSGVRDKAAFMDRCAAALALPGWFGRNWDALADCLTDLSWAPPAPGRLVVVSAWQDYAQAAPYDWETAQEVFASAVAYWRDQDTALEVVLALGPSV